MTNWGQLEHAYGSAEDIPGKLDQLMTEPTSERWTELYSALYHQGTVYSASFAALGRLAEIAQSEDDEQRAQALALAGAIMAGENQVPELGDIRATYAADISALLETTRRVLPEVPDDDVYLYLLEAKLAFEGQPVGNEAYSSLNNGELEVECPQCTEMCFMVIGEEGYFSTADDQYQGERIPLQPAEPADLDDLRRGLYDDALAHGHPEVAKALTYLYGMAICPECAESFSVIEQWEATF